MAPECPLPQQKARARGDGAGVQAPASIWRNSWPPATRTGRFRNRAVELSPSCPEWFQPQQKASPAGVMPQVCCSPAVNWLNRRLPATGTGVSRSVVLPSPNWPSMLRPQQ